MTSNDPRAPRTDRTTERVRPAPLPLAPSPAEGTSPCCSFVPPYLLRQVAESTGDRGLLARRQETLVVDERLRARRAAAGAATPPAAPDTSGNRVVYDAEHTEQLPGRPVRGADDPATGDAAVDEAHDYSGVAWDLFEQQFGRRSVDAAGTPLTVTVHYSTDYDNAFWDGTQLVFGDGDGEIFDRFTKPLDVTVHEFTHGVTQFTAGLTYSGQSGALNESVSDVFASMAKQKNLGQEAGQGDWLIGEGLFLPGVQARALRSMTEPGTAYDDPRLGKDPQVGSMADYVDTDEDNGGVHINSGIPNRAFALAAIALGGPSWERAGRVWYDTLTAGEVSADVDFATFAQATVASAGRLFADDATVTEQVRSAWQQVGVLPATDQPAEPQPDAGPAPEPQPGPGPDADPGPGPEAEPWSGGGTGEVPALPGEPGAEVLSVRRSGGYAGNVRFGELRLDTDPYGSELRRLLDHISVNGLSTTESQPDRFVYTVACRSWELTVPEQDLTPELSRVVEIVLDQGRLR